MARDLRLYPIVFPAVLGQKLTVPIPLQGHYDTLHIPRDPEANTTAHNGPTSESLTVLYT